MKPRQKQIAMTDKAKLVQDAIRSNAKAETLVSLGMSKPMNSKMLDQLGRQLYKMGEYKASSELLEKAIDISNNTTGCLKHLGLAYSKLGQDEDLQSLIDSNISRSDLNERQIIALADLMSRKAETSEAATQLLDRLGKKHQSEFSNGIAKIRSQAKRSSKAIDPVNAVKASSSQKNKSEKNLGPLGFAQSPVSLKTLQNAYKQEKSNINAKSLISEYLSLANSEHKSGNIENAEDYYKSAVDDFPNHYGLISKYGNFLAGTQQFDVAKKVLKRAHELSKGDGRHLKAYLNTLAYTHDYELGFSILTEWLEAHPEEKNIYLELLADLACGQGKHKLAANLLEQFCEICPENRVSGLKRRIDTHIICAGEQTNLMKSEFEVCQGYFQKNIPNLDEEQTRILDEIIDKGVCVSSFDALFGKSYQDMWREAETFVQAFENQPKIKELRQRIETCTNFNDDPVFAKMFKPSIINYRQEIGEMYAYEAPYQFYLNPRILDITNSYNEMLSKIRNVALWINPPIGGENLGNRKGSQIWHRDQEDQMILKCFIYYTDVNEYNGVTEYIPYSKILPSRKYSNVLPYPNSTGYPGEYLIAKHISNKDICNASGPKGSIVFLDTNGFHRGGYVTQGHRILTMATFLRPSSPYTLTNTRLSIDNTNLDSLSFEAQYGLS